MIFKRFLFLLISGFMIIRVLHEYFEERFILRYTEVTDPLMILSNCIIETILIQTSSWCLRMVVNQCYPNTS